MPMQETESRIQQKIVMHLQTQPGVVFSVPNESSNAREQMRKIATGLFAGVSDLVYLRPGGEAIFLEVKTPTGKQSERQKIFQTLVERLGFQYHIVRSVDEVKQIIK